MSLRDQILGQSIELARESVEVPAWGATVHVREFTAAERDRFLDEHAAGKFKDFRARLVAHMARDEAGERIFRAEDVATLAGMPARVLEPIVEACGRVNRFADVDLDVAAKN